MFFCSQILFRKLFLNIFFDLIVRLGHLKVLRTPIGYVKVLGGADALGITCFFPILSTPSLVTLDFCFLRLTNVLGD